MDENTTILVTLIAYKVALLSLGLWASKRTHDNTDFFLGGRKLGPWVGAMSGSASAASAFTLLGISGAAYAWGVSALWIVPACVGGFCLNWYVLAPSLQRLTHKSGALTVTEVLAGPSNDPRHRAIVYSASLIVLVSLLTYIASQFSGAGKAFAETFDLSMTEAVLIGAAVIVVYTLFGGFWAVSLTDTLQGFIMALASLLLPIGALIAVGGPAGLFEGLAAQGDPAYTSFTKGATGMAGLGFVIGVLGMGLGNPGQPHVVNRFMALENEQALVVGRRIAIGWASVVYGGMVLVGLCGRVLLSGIGDNEVVLIALSRELFPPVVAGVLVAAVMSAIMSTADSQLLVAASSISHDLRFGRDRDTAPDLLRSRLVVVGISLAAVGLALFGSQKIFSKVLFAWSAMGNAFGPPLLVAVLRREGLSTSRVLLAMWSGFSLSVAAYWYPPTSGTLFERVLPFVVALVISAWPRGTANGRA